MSPRSSSSRKRAIVCATASSSEVEASASRSRHRVPRRRCPTGMAAAVSESYSSGPGESGAAASIAAITSSISDLAPPRSWTGAALASPRRRGDERRAPRPARTGAGARRRRGSVRPARGRGEHRRRRRRGQALVAARPVHRVRAQADAGDPVVGAVHVRGALVGALVDAVERARDARASRAARRLRERVVGGDRRRVDDGRASVARDGAPPRAR